MRTSPPSPSDRLERVRFALATRHHLEAVQPSIPGRCFPVGSWCCRTTLNSLVLFLVCSDGRMVCTPRLLRRVKAEWYIVAPETSMLPKVNWLATGALLLEGQLQKNNRRSEERRVGKEWRSR